MHGCEMQTESYVEKTALQKKRFTLAGSETASKALLYDCAMHITYVKSVKRTHGDNSHVLACGAKGILGEMKRLALET